jgi:uncharacterized protein
MRTGLNPRLLKGIDEFNRGLYFECHETLEEIWLEEHGEDREFYQGIIQIAAGYFKWEQGVPRGAIKLWRAGLANLESYPSQHMGVALQAFIQGVTRNLRQIEAAYQAGGDDMSIEVPVLMLKPRAGLG